MINSIPELKYKIDLNDFLNFVASEKKLKQVISKLIQIACKRKEFLYFAGGVVRDYLLFKKNLLNRTTEIKDLDIVLQGDLENFLKEVLEKLKAEIIFKSQFLTYKVKIFLNFHEILIDFVTARKEFYENMAQLPKVIPSNFKDDILRRDFTINALIIGLSPPYEGYLIDLVNGLKDLEKKIIKPLYLNSFIDDPTRIFRGIRYKVRFDFEFSKEFYEALEMCFEREALKKLSSSRLSNEIKLFLQKEPRENLKKLLKITKDLKILEKSGVKINKNLDMLVAILNEIEEELNFKEKEKFFLLSLIDPAHLDTVERLCFNKNEILKIKKLLKEFENYYLNWQKMCLEEKINFLEKCPVYFILSLAVNFPEIKKDVLDYIKIYRKVKPELKGTELREFGIKEGKKIGEVLKLLRFKKIKEELKTKKEEIEFLKEFILKKSKN